MALFAFHLLKMRDDLLNNNSIIRDPSLRKQVQGLSLLAMIFVTTYTEC